MEIVAFDVTKALQPIGIPVLTPTNPMLSSPTDTTAMPIPEELASPVEEVASSSNMLPTSRDGG